MMMNVLSIKLYVEKKRKGKKAEQEELLAATGGSFL